MSDTKAQLSVPTTTFARPTTPRSTTASSIASLNELSPDLASAHEKREKAASVQNIKVPPPTPGKSGQSSPMEFVPTVPETSGHISTSMTTILAGASGKPFVIHTDLLTSRSPYFQALLAHQVPGKPSPLSSKPTGPSTHSPAPGPTLSYPFHDEFAFALFVRWLYGAHLPGPTDFHSLGHYISLHALALHFGVERLANAAVDLVRFYYRSENMTAPPYRLAHAYERAAAVLLSKSSSGGGVRSGAGADPLPKPNPMQAFLVATAAYRALCEAALSDAVRGLLVAGGPLAADFADALVRLSAAGVPDARKGPDCDWHVHEVTQPCRRRAAEAYEAD